MLPRLFHLQGALGKSEQDELVGHLANQVTALQLIVEKYIDKFGILPDLGGPAPDLPPTEEVEDPSQDAAEEAGEDGATSLP